jgi:predicted transcriptional regulator
MTFSVYLDDKLTKRLNRVASESGKARNALIREALEEWLARSRPERWPEAVLAFKGVRDAPSFEQTRKTLKPPREPFAPFKKAAG